MIKECNLCGYQPTEPELPDYENEDCAQCGGQGSVQTIDDEIQAETEE